MPKVKYPISIVIPAYNEADYIGLCLQSLVWQKTDKKFEVIIVDNNSTDKTRQIAESFHDKLNLRVICELEQGRGMARWRGFEEATGDIIFSTDADTILPSDWIEALLKRLEGKNIVAVTSSCDIDESSKFQKTTYNLLHSMVNEGYRLALGHYWLMGFSFAIKRDAYNKAGKINKSLNALDDVDLGRRVRKIGKISLVREAKVLTSNRRYKDGLASGLLGYVKPFIQVSLLKSDKVTMSDYR